MVARSCGSHSTAMRRAVDATGCAWCRTFEVHIILMRCLEQGRPYGGGRRNLLAVLDEEEIHRLGGLCRRRSILGRA